MDSEKQNTQMQDVPPLPRPMPHSPCTPEQPSYSHARQANHRATSLPPNAATIREAHGRGPPHSRLRRVSTALSSKRDLLKAAGVDRPVLLRAVLLLLLLWCIGTTLLLSRLARRFELLEGHEAADDAGVRQLLDKWRAGGQVVTRQLGKVPLISAAYIVVAPHVGWLSALMAPHFGPLRFVGTRLVAACRLLVPAILRLKPLLERVKPLLVLIEVRTKAHMLLAEWARKGQAAVQAVAPAGSVTR